MGQLCPSFLYSTTSTSDVNLGGIFNRLYIEPVDTAMPDAAHWQRAIYIQHGPTFKQRWAEYFEHILLDIRDTTYRAKTIGVVVPERILVKECVSTGDSDGVATFTRAEVFPRRLSTGELSLQVVFVEREFFARYMCYCRFLRPSTGLLRSETELNTLFLDFR